MSEKDCYAKELIGGKPVFKMLDGKGSPGQRVKTMEWELDSYINYCLYPLRNCINRMQGIDEPDREIQEFVDILDRLYDSAHAQLMKMGEAIDTDMGWIKIITTNETCRGGFFEQDFLDVLVEKEPEESK